MSGRHREQMGIVASNNGFRRPSATIRAYQRPSRRPAATTTQNRTKSFLSGGCLAKAVTPKWCQRSCARRWLVRARAHAWINAMPVGITRSGLPSATSASDVASIPFASSCDGGGGGMASASAWSRRCCIMTAWHFSRHVAHTSAMYPCAASSLTRTDERRDTAASQRWRKACTMG
jgi:hypothetical protein